MNTVIILFMWINVLTNEPFFLIQDCPDQECVTDMVQRAEADPAVIYYEVLGEGNPRAPVSGKPLNPPVLEVWKQ